ncbi:MAG: UvrD-helicase domain-containing protein [Peptococcaceae bacterium]|nr:UvrD-helicase domain-containing protein [Peptococcaceae bacterium]
MANRLIIAAAGSGKTTYIVKEASKIKDKKVLITTFTEANEAEIRNKFYDQNGCIPSNIDVQTWFSFLLEHGVRPFQGTFTDRPIAGILLVNQKSGVKVDSKSRPIYWGERDFDRHYFSNDYRLFTDKIAKLAVRCNEQTDGLVITRLAIPATQVSTA